MLIDNKIISVLTIKDYKKSLDLAKCLYDSGIVNLDIRLRTQQSKKAIELIKNSKFKFNIGIGTVLSLEDLYFVKSLGIKYAYSPNTDVKILNNANKLDIQFIPGISNIDNVISAVKYNCKYLKYYPAEKSGGVSNLDLIVAKSKIKNLKFIAMGGITSINIKPYLKHKNVIGIGTSWIAEESLIESSNWKEIRKRASLLLES